MLKNSLIALAALATIAVAAPAFAKTDDVFGVTNDYQQLDQAKSSVQQRLEHRGLNVNNIDEWDGYVRADVTLADGSHATRFFEPGSLQPVKINNVD